jgi:hypothetical protein
MRNLTGILVCVLLLPFKILFFWLFLLFYIIAVIDIFSKRLFWYVNKIEPNKYEKKFEGTYPNFFVWLEIYSLYPFAD